MPFYGKAHIAYIPDGKVVGSQQTGKNRGSVCKASADPGTVDGTDRRSIDGIFKAAGSNGHAGGRAYVHDDAGGKEAWEQNRNICDARRF